MADYALIIILLVLMRGRKMTETAGRPIRYLGIFGVLIAAAIILYVLFQVPHPGVADQGDFDRVMSVAGLQLAETDINDPQFVRFLDYTVTEYKISNFDPGQILAGFRQSSQVYLITPIKLLCRGFALDTFKTEYLAIIYSIIYILGIYLIIVFSDIKDLNKMALFIPVSLLILLDGNYLVWFNSLYGEAAMIVTLLLYVAAWTYYIYHRKALRDENGVFSKIIFIYGAAFLFLGSKLQVVSALPIILLMLVVLLVENKNLLRPSQLVLLSFFTLILAIYPLSMNLADKGSGRDRQYNAVFYGILKDSHQPVQDLKDLGLNPDMAVDAGKHAFLEPEEYIRYVPHSQITSEEFYSKIGNVKLLGFYVMHPQRFVEGMEYTASRAFTTSTFLGKYQRKDSELPVSEFNRFTIWSSWREKHLPKNLWFVLSLFSIIFTVSIISYRQNRKAYGTRAQIRLLWGVMLIGLTQFPMPYIGNGAADTYKQLYLFNFVFDLMLLVSICWSLSILTNIKKHHP